MGNFNKVLLLGNMTRDVELRHVSGDTAVGGFGLAINRSFKTGAGEQREEVTFVDCEAWGRTAEVMAQYLKKGRPVHIEGRLKLDQWEDKDGGKRSKLKVVVESFQFVDSNGGKGESNDEGYGASVGGYQSAKPGGYKRPPEPQYNAEDDIPF